MFDFDPDDAYEEDMVDDPNGDHEEDVAGEMLDETDDSEVEDGFDTEEADDSIVEEAIIAGTIFGLGVEESWDKVAKREAAKKASERGERSPGSASLKELGKSIKRKLRPFEQWIDDVIHGRKTLDDEL